MPAASSLCYAYEMHASRRQQQACVGKAAAGGICACVAMVIVRSDRGHRPERLPLAACSSYLGISCVSADPREPGRPWATAGATVESHVARLCKFAPPMCSVHSRTGRRRALRLVRLAARQLTAVAQPLQGPFASARTCVPLRITIDHHRSKPSLEPILDRATKRRCFCAMLAAATTDPRRAALVCVPVLAGRL